MPDIPDLAVRGTPWQLGIRCDGPACDVSFEADFMVPEHGTRGERLRVVLDYAENHGWRVEWRQPIGRSLTYCPACSRAETARDRAADEEWERGKR